MMTQEKDLKDLADLKRRNKASDRYFWSRDTVAFFNHRDESKLIDGHFFIYSIQNDTTPRIYCIGWGSRQGFVNRIRDGFRSADDAREWIDAHSGYYTEGCDGGCYNANNMAMRYPIGEDSAALLCYECWNAENDRRERENDQRLTYSWHHSRQEGEPIAEDTERNRKIAE